jgi:hypothetical protein
LYYFVEKLEKEIVELRIFEGKAFVKWTVSDYA